MAPLECSNGLIGKVTVRPSHVPILRIGLCKIFSQLFITLLKYRHSIILVVMKIICMTLY